ncbi:hypothetical protein HQ346_02280 [Rhodococcus sp. BP-252]|uniref:hypothetical protein n=1 Tax=Nocardiaceae TaxID=85025 RepID=UPI000A72608D|nr:MULTISPECIES: hypothetical protein [Rhodococcus]MBY6410379.1 hypothetical protein [Rhodococcus sp. BP-320]MBY6416261.1 hypothetical protein [Rhodococcus sp. BP-321]MBY6420256.1 hypothetical protein [Rhodococcus sp. BP-324]MBY6424935.1 hypothetical protein [Rhodococcus sp. BP-323]MBY6430359.1 hypothetical protein [Rhodococcus sp. BP-322]
MTQPNHDEPNLDDVIVPTEEVHPDHREHAKEPKHLDDTELDARTEHEREETGADE